MTTADAVSHSIIGAAIEIHRAYGPGLLESVYTTALAQDLLARGLSVDVQKPLPLTHKGMTVPRAFVLDLLVQDCVIVEVKCVEAINSIHIAQTLTYLRLTKLTLGLVLNFKVRRMVEGIRRVVNDHREDTGTLI